MTEQHIKRELVKRGYRLCKKRHNIVSQCAGDYVVVLGIGKADGALNADGSPRPAAMMFGSNPYPVTLDQIVEHFKLD